MMAQSLLLFWSWSKHWAPSSSSATISPSITALDALIDFAIHCSSGKRLVRSRWCREVKRTWPSRKKQIARYPSHLGSNTQPTRENGAPTFVANIGSTDVGIGSEITFLRLSYLLSWYFSSPLSYRPS